MAAEAPQLRLEKGIAYLGKTVLPLTNTDLFWVKEGEVRVRCLSPDETGHYDYTFRLDTPEKVKQFVARLFDQTNGKIALQFHLLRSSFHLVEKELVVAASVLTFDDAEQQGAFLEHCAHRFFKGFTVHLNDRYEKIASTVLSTRVGRDEEIRTTMQVCLSEFAERSSTLPQLNEGPDSYIVTPEGLLPKSDPTAAPLDPAEVIESDEEFSLF